MAAFFVSAIDAITDNHLF